jgi:release factor glutamine methyltransferase
VARTALELARQAADVLRERGLENARLEAELLLASVLGIVRLDLYLQFDRPVDEAELDRFRGAVRRRLRREPLQYIVGEAAFRQLVLKVDPRVLIPRPETEILVGEVLKWSRGRREPSALDIGTGSGAIALSLAHEGEFGRIVATDVSADALDVARANAARLGLGDRIEFRLGEAWRAVAQDERFDIVASNPPYVAERDRDGLQPEVLEWEPAGALFAGDDGRAVIDALIEGAPAHLERGGLLAIEVGETQARAVIERVHAHGGYGRAHIVPDLTGRERVVLAETH